MVAQPDGYRQSGNRDSAADLLWLMNRILNTFEAWDVTAFGLFRNRTKFNQDFVVHDFLLHYFVELQAPHQRGGD
jgi:hypothetical protein